MITGMDIVWLETIKRSAMALILIATIYFDLRFRIIPNWLMALGFIIGLCLQIFSGLGVLLESIWLALLLASPFIMGFQKGYVGGGDVKLVAVTALIAGPGRALTMFVTGIVVAATFCLYALLKARAQSQHGNAVEAVWVPYGALYSLGALFTIFL